LGTMRIDVRRGETLNIDEGKVRVTLEEKSGSRARLKIAVDDGVVVSIDPKEQEGNKALTRPKTA